MRSSGACKIVDSPLDSGVLVLSSVSLLRVAIDDDDDGDLSLLLKLHCPSVRASGAQGLTANGSAYLASIFLLIWLIFASIVDC